MPTGGGREQLSERYFVSVDKGGSRQPRSIGERKSCVFTVSLSLAHCLPWSSGVCTTMFMFSCLCSFWNNFVCVL